jgi:SAM-dependent methyltransferase
MSNPILEQEAMYDLPYHWFPARNKIANFEWSERRRIVFELIEQHITQSVESYLDVGCGDGRWTYEITEHFGPVRSYGIDILRRATRFAKILAPAIMFQTYNGRTLPFPNECFDLISCIEVLEHVEDDWEEEFLAEQHRVLRSTGVLLLTTPSWNARLSKHHFRHYSIDRLLELLNAVGFQVQEIRGHAIPCYDFKHKLRMRTGDIPKLWKLWKFTCREAPPEKAITLMAVARPES